MRAPGAKTASQDSGLGQVVLVEQDPILFSGTIRENIMLGLEHCKKSELLEAATAAGAMDFIEGLEQGWDTGKNWGDTKGILGPGASSRGWSRAATLVRAEGMGAPLGRVLLIPGSSGRDGRVWWVADGGVWRDS